MRTLTLFGLVALAACNGDKTTPSNTGETGTGGTTDTNTTGGGGFTVSGNVVNLDRTPAAEGLCGQLLDPTPVVAGGDPIVLASATVGAGGALVFADVTTESAIGLLVDVRDCATVGTTTVYPTATGIPYELYSALGDGDTLDGQTFFSIDNETMAGLAGSATAAGYAGDLAADGFLLGFVLDATGTPIGGATVTCAGAACTDAWYLDADPGDGLFTTTGAVNVATDPAVGGFLFPMAGIGNYTADDGGVHTFTPQLNGSNPGVATVTAFYGQ